MLLSIFTNLITYMANIVNNNDDITRNKSFLKKQIQIMEQNKALIITLLLEILLILYIKSK